MIKVDKCPFCNQKNRTEVQKQEFNDVYIDLINPELNKEVRYWYECDNCNFLYRSPKLDEKEQEILYEKYRDVSFRNETADEYFTRITSYDNENSENYQKISWFLEKINNNILEQKNKVLDVGCGGGVLLHKIKDMLPKSLTYGVEPNILYSNLARDRSNAVEIKTSYFYKNLFEEKFDIIVSSDVLEHVDKPTVFLKDIYYSLRKNGILFLEIPSPTNFNELKSEHDMFNIAHHVFYTENIIKEYLINTGFEHIMIKDIKNNSNVWKLRIIAYKQSRW